MWLNTSTNGLFSYLSIKLYRCSTFENNLVWIFDMNISLISINEFYMYGTANITTKLRKRF